MNFWITKMDWLPWPVKVLPQIKKLCLISISHFLLLLLRILFLSREPNEFLLNFK